MLDQKVIENVEGYTIFSVNDLYQFYFNSLTVAENLQRSWKQEVREASEVAANLLGIVQNLYEKAIIADESGESHTIDVDQALASKEYTSYLNSVCELEKVELTSLSIP